MKKSLQFPLLLGTSFILSLLSWLMMNIYSNTLLLEVEFFLINSISFNFAFIFDKISVSFSMVVLLISMSVFTFAHTYMEEDVFKNRFLWILMLFVVSMNLLVLSGSLMLLLLGWDGLGITSFALIIYYQSNDSLLAGFQTLMINRLGDALIVLSTFLFALCSQFSFFAMEDVFVLSGLMLMLCIAGLTKSAQYPFSSWLPAAMAAPTPVSALVHSSTLVTAGIFLMIRLSNNICLSTQIQQMLLFLGSITCLLGGWAATFENDLKKVIALSTLSQLGVMVFSLGLGYSNLALFHLYTHALFKALLFLAAGNILMASYGFQDIRLLGSVGLAMPITMLMFNVSSLCLIGGPFLSAFYSKHLILEVSASTPLGVFPFLLMMFATFFTAKYVLRTLKCISWNKPTIPILSVPLNFFTTFPVGVLSLGGMTGGKLFSMLDLTNMEVATLSSFWSFTINLITISGLMSGFMMQGAKKNHTLSKLFYLTPSISTKPLKMIKSLNTLDYGWLEPYSYFSLSSSGGLMSHLGVWPSKQVFIGLSFILMLFILIIGIL